MGALAAVALENLPAIIASLRDVFVKRNPDAPVPSDSDVIAAYQEALAQSLATDAAWLAAHPVEPASDQ
jgi:hypothetical protein